MGWDHGVDSAAVHLQRGAPVPDVFNGREAPHTRRFRSSLQRMRKVKDRLADEAVLGEPFAGYFGNFGRTQRLPEFVYRTKFDILTSRRSNKGTKSSWQLTVAMDTKVVGSGDFGKALRTVSRQTPLGRD
jgi:hypothetical protein